VAKVKVVNTQLNQNLNGTYFNDTPSNTIFSFGKFFVTTNFDNKVNINYTNTLSSFVRPVTLETLGVNDTQSEIINYYNTNAVLNLDKSDLNTFVRYGSAYEFLRISIQDIILKYPGSLFANSQKDAGGNPTYSGYTYDVVSDVATFYVPTGATDNNFGLVFNTGNTSTPDDNELKNLNLSYEKYVIWTNVEPNTLFPIIGYTGNTINSVAFYDTGNTISVKDYIKLQVEGNPFALAGTGTSASVDFHLRPNNIVFEEFRALLNSYEQNIVGYRKGSDGFEFTLKNPTLLDNGKIVYADTQILWGTGDGYNIDINTPSYQKFLKIMLTIGGKYDAIKTDLIARFLTPASLKTYDFTEDGKITALLRLYGREFDQIRQFIDSLVNINKVTYDKINNIPDQLVMNMANTFGWDYFSLVNEKELVEGFLTIDDEERNLNEDILPAEIDVELWRRILNNTSYFWKSKGTRNAIKSMFLLIGIPEPFINITEYVYTVEGRIDPNTVPFIQADFPSNSLPYDTSGYPVAPLETNDFYFQISGNTDSGQRYLDVFRQAGFNLTPVVDNKKSWEQSGATTRVSNTTPRYYQEDSRLVINTKEVDVALDTARGIEYDVYEYIKKDFIANSSGFVLQYSYVNLSLPVGGSQSTFQIPTGYTDNYNLQGDFEVRYNGILLNAPKTGNSTTTGLTTTRADYIIDYNTNTFTLTGETGAMYAKNIGTRRDVIQVTFVNSGTTIAPISGVTIDYVVARLQKIGSGVYLDLPSYPRGDLQLTIDGIALTKGTSQFTADYILDPANSSGGTNRIIIQNPDVINYLSSTPNDLHKNEVQVAYMTVNGSNDINLRSEIVRVDSFNTSKIYFNPSANKYVYKLNYKMTDIKNVKFLIDGIALEPNKDYSLNVQNPYEIFLPRGIKYGMVISAYYLVGDVGAFTPVINDEFGLGDISELSFLEFLELVQRKMINARTRKVVTDFKGGWYPTVLRIYESYLQRALLPDDNPLQSNGYTFENLYPFLSKYNAFFQRFVDQLLSATIILKRGGLLIRNTIFTKQKHWYKRGVNVANGTTQYDLRGNTLLQYLGNDGSTFSINQEGITPPPPPPTPLYVETSPGVLGSLTTGGRNIIGFNILSEFGIDYKLTYPNPYPSYPYGGSIPIGIENLLEGIDYDVEILPDNWTRISEAGPLYANNFSMTLTGLDEDTWYDYRAFVESLATGFTGSTRYVKTLPPPTPTPSIETKTATIVGNQLLHIGAINIVGYEDVEYYALQYRKSPSTTWLYRPAIIATGPLTVNYYNVANLTGLVYSSTYEYRAYMKVNGTSYYGATKTATIPAEPTVVPTVTTSTSAPYDITTSGFCVDNNNVSSKGIPATLSERGMLYTQSSTYGNPHTLTVNNYPTYVKKSLKLPPDATGNYDSQASGLNAGSTTYYRAFATNATGTAYGTVKTQATASSPTISMLYIFDAETNGVPSASNGGIISHPSSNMTLTIGWQFYKGALTGLPYETSVTVYCNGNQKYYKACICKQASSNWSGPTSGTFTPFTVTPTDNVEVCECAITSGTAEGSCAKGSISAVSSPYTISSQRSTTAYTCGTFTGGGGALPFLPFEV